jgi:hypothetical protein
MERASLPPDLSASLRYAGVQMSLNLFSICCTRKPVVDFLDKLSDVELFSDEQHGTCDTCMTIPRYALAKRGALIRMEIKHHLSYSGLQIHTHTPSCQLFPQSVDFLVCSNPAEKKWYPIISRGAVLHPNLFPLLSVFLVTNFFGHHK